MHKRDYHKVFNNQNFAAWFENQLLPNLKDPSIIIMDNAAYHCVYPDTVPKVSKAKRAELVAYCNLKNIPVDPGDTVPLLRKKVSAFIKEHEERVVEILAR